MAAAKRGAQYGKDFKILTIQVTTEEHQAIKIKSAQYAVTISDFFRIAAADDAMWNKAKKIKMKESA